MLTRDFTAKLGDVSGLGWLAASSITGEQHGAHGAIRLRVKPASQRATSVICVPACSTHVQVGLSKAMTHTFASKQGGVGTFAWVSASTQGAQLLGVSMCTFHTACLPIADPLVMTRCTALLRPPPPAPQCAPEVLQGKPCTYSADVYSFGE